jgi:two-component system, OmpR family, phosphate regulon sensor histidine kinase PhoR
MTRMSARTIIILPWMLATIMALIIGHVSLGDGIIVGFFSLALAVVVANHVTRTLRSLSHELRASSTVAENTRDMPEFQELRRTIRKLTQDADLRAAAAADAERRFLSVLESITEGIIQVDAGARFVSVNAAARQMLGLPSDLRGQSVRAVVRHPELRSCIERAATGVSFQPVEVTLDDRHLLISPHRYRLDAFTDETSGAVIAIVDLTEFRRLENVRRDFVANVSHELKTPLTSIRGYTETLLGDDELPTNARHQFLAVIQKNTERLQRIIDDLLDLSRLQSGGWTPELQTVDVIAFTREVWSACEAGHRKNIDFKVLANTGAQVLADPSGLRHILTNLFDNAIRYTPEGGTIRVEIVTSNDKGDVAMIAVTDNGSGIPRDALPRVFERFYRADPARSRAEGGTGLGLSIVKHLVERMNGEITADSELGKGTTIRFTMPLASPSE